MSENSNRKNSVFYLIYHSTETSIFTDDMLHDLLKKSAEHNVKHHITGMLLYVKGQKFTKTSGRFMQLLEGNESKIRNLYEKIQQDERHKGIVLMKEGRYPKRLFTEWSMGFEKLDDRVYQAVSAHFNLSEIFMECEPNSSDAPLTFLQNFTQKAMQG